MCIYSWKLYKQTQKHWLQTQKKEEREREKSNTVICFDQTRNNRDLTRDKNCHCVKESIFHLVIYACLTVLNEKRKRAHAKEKEKERINLKSSSCFVGLCAEY